MMKRGRICPVPRKTRALLAVGLLLFEVAWPGLSSAEKRSVDIKQSVIKVYVYKSGLFSAFAHNHEILAPIVAGIVEDSETPFVELGIEAARMQVLDPGVSDKQRVEIEQTMLGPKVLDTERYPNISFRSTAVEKKGDVQWIVRGSLDLHGQVRPVVVEVSRENGHYRGSVMLKQSDFGIRPVSLF